jgi:hypothetical protein
MLLSRRPLKMLTDTENPLNGRFILDASHALMI